MDLPTYMDCFLVSCFLTLPCNFDAVFYAFLAMYFLPAILYPWIIFELLRSPPGHSHRNSACTAYRQSLPAGDRTIRQPLTAKWGQDKGPGTNPLTLSSRWIDEGVATSPGRTWKTGKSLPSTLDVSLPSGEAWGSPPPFATTHQQNGDENSGWLCFFTEALASSH